MLTGTTMLAGGGDFVPRDRENPKRDLDLVELPRRLRLRVTPSQPEEIAPLVNMAGQATGVSLAPAAVVARVAEANPETIWTFRRNDRIVGGVAFLLLNREGLSALLADALSLRDPPLSFLTPSNVVPAAIYTWALFGRSLAAEGIVQVIARFRQDPYRQTDFYTIPVTRDGLRFMLDFGFVPVRGHPRPLFRYVRLANRTNCGRNAHAPLEPA